MLNTFILTNKANFFNSKYVDKEVIPRITAEFLEISPTILNGVI